MLSMHKVFTIENAFDKVKTVKENNHLIKKTMETTNNIRTDLDHLFSPMLAIERVNAFAKVHEQIKKEKEETRKKINTLLNEMGAITTLEIIEIHQAMKRDEKEIESAIIEIDGQIIKINYLIHEVMNRNTF